MERTLAADVPPSELARLAFGRLPHAALLTSGREHTVSYATELFCSYFGVGDTVGKPLHAAYPAIALAPCAQAMDQALGDGARVTLERISIGNGNGPSRYTFVAEPLALGDGRVVGVLLMAERYVESPASSPNTPLHRQILESTLDAMHEGVSVYDADGKIVFANHSADLMFGTENGGLIGRSISALSALPSWEGERLLESMNAEIRHSGSWSGDRVNQRLNGEIFVSAAQVTTFELEGQQFHLCVEEDVTAQRRSEEQAAFLANAASILGQSLDYRATLSALAQLCVPRFSDLALVDVYSESGALERVGVAARDPKLLVTLRETPMLAPRLHDLPNDATTGRMSTGLTTTPLFLREVDESSVDEWVAAPLAAQQWRDLHVRSWMSLPVEQHGEQLGTIALAMTEPNRRFSESDLEVAIDLASRVANAVDVSRLHSATEIARDEAERANRAKSELLAHASHDLRTPLNAISGYTELLELEILGPINDAQRDALARVQRSQRHLLALINDLLHFTKLESGNVEFDFAEIDLAIIASEVAALLRDGAATKGIELRCESERGVRAWADEEKVFQVVLNLVRNAVKFTSNAGEVVIRVAEEEGGERSSVTVTDNGIGIPPDKVDAIFEPFTQLGRSFSRPQEGSGLGLAISRELTRAMGGVLQVSSTPGRGSTFTLTLPRRRPARATTA